MFCPKKNCEAYIKELIKYKKMVLLYLSRPYCKFCKAKTEIGQETHCLPYVGFFSFLLKLGKTHNNSYKRKLYSPVYHSLKWNIKIKLISITLK